MLFAMYYIEAVWFFSTMEKDSVMKQGCRSQLMVTFFLYGSQLVEGCDVWCLHWFDYAVVYKNISAAPPAFSSHALIH